MSIDEVQAGWLAGDDYEKAAAIREAEYRQACEDHGVVELPEPPKMLPRVNGFVAYAVAPEPQEPCPVYDRVLAEHDRQIRASQRMSGRYEDDNPPTAPR